MSTTLATSDRLVAADNDFGFRLLAQLAGKKVDRNIFLSAPSIAIALTMTCNGAHGQTQQDLAATLGISRWSQEEVNAAHAALRADWGTLDPAVRLEIANVLFARHDITLAPGFVQRNEHFFAARVLSADFTDARALAQVNGWVQDKTRGKISDLIKPRDLAADTVLLLLNAIYFKGDWQAPFDKRATRAGVFHLPDGAAKATPMMHQSGEFQYLETPDFQAIRLPYGQGRTAAYIFLPAPAADLISFQKLLSTTTWQRWLTRFRPHDGTLVLPRFDITYEVELKEALTALGMGVAFTPAADFRGISPDPLFISQVRHKAMLEINEQGAEAAAATAVVMIRGLPSARPFRMIVDHPFFIAICDDDTDLILFMGYVAEPM